MGMLWHVQGLEIPDKLKALYKTVWELRQRTLVEMAADRGAFIDQSQSFNVHMSDPNFGKLTSLHFHAWKVRRQIHLPQHGQLLKPFCFLTPVCLMQIGLKTGMYYLRTRAAADAIKFTVDQQALARNKAARASKGLAAAPAPAGLIDGAPLKVCKCLRIFDGTVVFLRDDVSDLGRLTCMECRTSMEQCEASKNQQTLMLLRNKTWLRWCVRWKTKMHA